MCVKLVLVIMCHKCAPGLPMECGPYPSYQFGDFRRGGNRKWKYVENFDDTIQDES